MLRVLLLFSLTVVASGFRIAGWKMDVYDERSRTKYYHAHSYGDISGSNEITWGAHYCWNRQLDARGYCYIRIKLTTDTSKEHYQIVGGFKRVMDRRSRYIDYESTWGQTEENNPTRARMAEGFAWSAKFDDWGYMYLDMFVFINTNPGFISALGTQQLKANQRSYMKPEVVVGGSTSGAERQDIGEFQCWTDDWEENTVINMRMYRVPTQLQSIQLLLDQQTTTQSPQANAVMAMILVNNGCGTYQEGSFGTFQDTETVTQSNRAMFTQTFNFEFSLSYEVSFDVFITSQSLNIGFSFGYSTSSEFETTKTETKSRIFTWPTYCPPGYKCTTTIMKDSGDAVIPVDLHFKRSGETFTKRQTMQAHLETIRQERHTERIPTNENC